MPKGLTRVSPVRLAAVWPRPQTVAPPAPARARNDLKSAPIVRHDVGRYAVGPSSAPSLAQTKLEVGEPHDSYEREAEATAEAIMRMPLDGPDPRVPLADGDHANVVQRMCAACEDDETLRRQPDDDEDETDVQPATVPGALPTVDAHLEGRINTLRGAGAPIPADARAFFEPRFGHDFSRVRVHTGVGARDAARSLRARAFTTRNDVVFGDGQFALHTEQGRRLLAHELTHVIQQGGGGPAPLQRQTVPEPDDAAHRRGATLPYQEAKEAAARERIGLPNQTPEPPRKKVCLTFDDGPNAGTDDVLNALGSDVKATFFLTGKNLAGSPERQASLLARIVANHQIGNHTFTHDPEQWGQYEKLKKQPRAAQEKTIKREGFEQNRTHFEKLVEQHPEAFREQGMEKFPGFSLARLPGSGKFFPMFVAMAKSLNLTHVGWDMEFAPNGLVKAPTKFKDWKGLTGVEAEFDRLPEDKNILLLHDADWTGKRPLLGTLLTRLREPAGGNLSFGTLTTSGACG